MPPLPKGRWAEQTRSRRDNRPKGDMPHCGIKFPSHLTVTAPFRQGGLTAGVNPRPTKTDPTESVGRQSKDTTPSQSRLAPCQLSQRESQGWGLQLLLPITDGRWGLPLPPARWFAMTGYQWGLLQPLRPAFRRATSPYTGEAHRIVSFDCRMVIIL